MSAHWPSGSAEHRGSGVKRSLLYQASSPLCRITITWVTAQGHGHGEIIFKMMGGRKFKKVFFYFEEM